MRLKASTIHLSLAYGLIAFPQAARAVEEIGEPAGEMPEAAELPEVPPTEDAQPVEAPKAELKQTPGKKNAKPAHGKADEKAAETWDSYSEAGSGGVAQEITKGVRVEDIVEPPSDYRYAAFGKSDPFVPPMVTSDKPLGPGNLEIPIVSPLQRHDVATLSLVGIWQLPSGERKAMVMTPAGGKVGEDSGGGQGIIVKNGDPIGNRGGKILAIGDDFLTVREFMLAADGTRQYEDQQMYMGTRSPDEQPGKIVFKPGEEKTETKLEGSGPQRATDNGGMNGQSSAAPRPAASGLNASKDQKAGVGNGDLGAKSEAQGKNPPQAGGSAPQPSASAAGDAAKPSAYKPLSPPPALPDAPALPALPALPAGYGGASGQAPAAATPPTTAAGTPTTTF